MEKIHLRPSNRMSLLSSDNAEEHTFIRLSKKARGGFNITNDTVSIETDGGLEISLKVHQALRGDLGAMRKNNKPFETVGFVTRATYNKIKGRMSKDSWIAETDSSLYVGSDPEFGLITDKGIFQYAAHVYNDGLNAALGHDGPCMEIRPTQSRKVGDHIRTIKTLLKRAEKSAILRKFSWYTGATFKAKEQQRRYLLGGHIHIGDPTSLKGKPSHLVMDIKRRVASSLNELVGLPLTTIDMPYANYRRTTYGKPGITGNQGDLVVSNNKFEWKLPSAIWLTHPDYAQAVLGTTKAVAEACYKSCEDAAYKENWIKTNFLHTFCKNPIKDTVKTLCSTTPSALGSESLSDIHSRLRKLSTYKKYKSEIDRFISLTTKRASSPKIDFFGAKKNWL